jgi:cold shock CspA family protein
MFRSRSYLLFYSTSCVLLGDHAGTIRKWEQGSRFGFVRDDDSSQSIFVHRSDCLWRNENESHKSIAVGTRVAYDLAFDTKKADGSKRCKNVTLEDGERLPSGPYADSDGWGGGRLTDNNNNVDNSNSNSNSQKYQQRRDTPNKKDPLLERFENARDLTGTVRVKPRSFGFIDFEPDDETGKKYSLFFHKEDVIGASGDGILNIEAGDVVVFDLIEDQKKPGVAKATNVSVKKKRNEKKYSTSSTSSSTTNTETSSTTTTTPQKKVVKEFDVDDF